MKSLFTIILLASLVLPASFLLVFLPVFAFAFLSAHSELVPRFYYALEVATFNGGYGAAFGFLINSLVNFKIFWFRRRHEHRSFLPVTSKEIPELKFSEDENSEISPGPIEGFEVKRLSKNSFWIMSQRASNWVAGAGQIYQLDILTEEEPARLRVIRLPFFRFSLADSGACRQILRVVHKNLSLSKQKRQTRPSS